MNGAGLALSLAAVLAAAAVPAQSQQPPSLQFAASQSAGLAEGEVRKIDKDARKITLRHGEIKNLEMPAMTMVFQVRDAALLDKLQTGDKVKFRAEKIGGTYTVTAIETVK